MNDLINKQDVLDLIMETDPFWAEGTTRAIFDGVMKISAAMLVASIVRCRDCMWQGDDEHCPVCNSCGRGSLPGGDWFCAAGERKK